MATAVDALTEQLEATHLGFYGAALMIAGPLLPNFPGKPMRGVEDCVKGCGAAL